MKKIFFVLIIINVVSVNVYAQSTNMEELLWLTGKWKQEKEKSITYEEWVKSSGKTFEGKGYRINKETKEKMFEESLLITEMGSEFFYISKVSENSLPIVFKLIFSGNQKAVFENTAHDFPQRISYEKTSENTLKAVVEGNEKGKYHSIEFVYKRVD